MMDGPEPKRLRLSKVQLEEMTKDDIINHWIKQEQYVDVLETKASDGQKDNCNSNVDFLPCDSLSRELKYSELVSLRESEEKMKQQQSEATRRENVLVMRLTTKEQEMQEYANQIQELKQAQVPGMAQLRSTLLDPAVNLMFERMKKELELMKAKLEETQNDLSAWKFTPDSNTGKRLMAKCRLLHQENEELGKMISSGRVAKLEGDLALQRNFSEEMKKSQLELDEFLMELDEDVEGMQSTIYYLQQQLRESKETISKLQKEMGSIKILKDSSVKPMETDANFPAIGLSESSSKNAFSDTGHVMDVCDDSNELELRTSDMLANEFQAQKESSRPFTPKSNSTSPRTNGEPKDQPPSPISRPSGCTMDIDSPKAIYNNISSVSPEDCKSERQRTLSPHIRYTPPPPGHESPLPLNLHRNPSPNSFSMPETSTTPPPRTDTPPARSYTPPPKMHGVVKASKDEKGKNGLSGKAAAEEDHLEDSQNSDSCESMPSPHTPAEPHPNQMSGDDKDALETAVSTLKRNKSIDDNDHNYDHRTDVEKKRTSIPNGVIEMYAGKGDKET